jgi:hypothetical protein
MEVNVKEILAGFIQHARLSGVGELESNFLEELVAGFDTNSKEARRAMRKLLAHDNHRFFCSACRILKSGVETAGREYLMKLLLEGDLLLVCLADPMLFSLETALDLAKVFVRLDPLLDFSLMQLLFRGDRAETGEVDAEQAMRVLELVPGVPQDEWRETVRMFDWIERNSSPDAVLIGNLDPVLYLYTGRKSVRGFVQNPYLLHYTADERALPLGRTSELLETIRWYGANYLIAAPNASFKEGPYLAHLTRDLLREHPNQFLLAYQSADSRYRIYAIALVLLR